MAPRQDTAWSIGRWYHFHLHWTLAGPWAECDNCHDDQYVAATVDITSTRYGAPRSKLYRVCRQCARAIIVPEPSAR